MTGTEPTDETNIIRILHVDDEEDQRVLLKVNLESVNVAFRVESIESPLKALESLRSGEYDCVVADYQMPMMDGIELCTLIRKTSSVPFIIFTGRGSEEVASKAFKAGVDDYVRKEKELAHYHVLARRIKQVVERHKAVRLLNMQRGLLDSVVMHSPVGISLVRGSDLRYQVVNPFYQMIAPGKEMLGRTIREVWPEVYTYLEEIFDRVLSTGEPHRAEDERFTMRRSPDGPLEEAFFSWSLIRVPLPAGAGWGVLNTALETTERVKAQKEKESLLTSVQAERDRLSSLVNSIQDEVWFADANGNFTLANPAALREFELDSTAQGVNIEKMAASLRVYRPDGSPRPAEEAPPLEALRGKTVRDQEEMVLTPAKGEIRWRQVSASPVKAPDGSIIGSVSVVRDITEAKRAEEALRDVELRNKELVDSINDGFFALDREWRFTYVNERAARNLGYKPADLIGKNIWKVIPGIVGTDQEAHYREAMENREKGRLHVKDAFSDASYDIAVYPSPEGISVLWSDFTYQRVGEEELERRANLMRSGIELIGDVPWGTHFCQFYNTKNDLLDMLVPYFKAGLEGNEFCMWITAKPLPKSEIVKAMKKAIPGFSRYLESGQMEILSYRDWYLRGGGFESDRVLQGWVDKLEAALKKDYSGLRLTGNTFWLEKKHWGAFTDYEEAVNNVIGNYKMVALCTYSLDKCNANEIIDVVKNHQFALIKREGRWEVIESGEQRKAEAALRVSEERYRRIVETAQEGIAVSSPGGTFNFVNQRFADMLGYGRDEVMGRSALDFMTEDMKAEAAKPRSQHDGAESSRAEHRFTRKDGSTLWTLASSSLLYDADGRHAGALTMYVDITRRKLDEQALLQAKLEWERTFDHVPDLITVLDSNHRITRANKAFADTLSISPQRCVGLTCYECVHGRDDPPEICPHAKTLVDGHEHTAEVYEPRLGGYYVVSTTPLKDDESRVVGSVHVARNITERKLAEEMIAAANEELKAKNERLEETTAEIEALNEELHASNEELRSANDALRVSEESLASMLEELRTTNEQLTRSEEELSASNEELRLSNDELMTAREQIQEHAEGLERLVEERTREIKVVSERLDTFINSAMDSFSLWDSSLNLVDANQAWLSRIPGTLKKEELLGRNMADVYPGVKVSGNYGKYIDVVRTGLPYETELTPLHPSFGKKVYSITAFKVGDGLGIISRDVTERRQLIDDLERASVYNRNLIEASLDPLVTISAEGKITDVNRATEEVTGVSRERLIGSEFPSYFTDPEEAKRGYTKVLNEGSVRDYPLAIRHVNGRITDVLYNASVYRNQAGEVQGVFAAARDVTYQKRLESRLRETQQHETVERISAMVAHDIRNPLNSTYQALQMAKNQPGSAEHMMDLAEKSLVRAINMIEELRANSRMIKPNKAPVDFSALVNEMMRNIALHEGVMCECAFNGDLKEVLIDPTLIQRVLENLLSNALEAMPGGGTLKLRACREGDELLVQVMDTGVGIPEGATEKIFQPLYTTKAKGVGLGLSYCKRAVEAHGGTISFTSKAGEGTTFNVRLPAR